MTDEPAAEDKVQQVTDEATDRETPREKSADEARQEVVAHDKRVRRFLLRLSLANWGIAILAWTISAFLGITSPASIMVYSVLFVIGLIAAILAILAYLVEKFGHEPAMHFWGEPAGDRREDDAGDGGDGPPYEGDAPAATPT